MMPSRKTFWIIAGLLIVILLGARLYAWMANTRTSAPATNSTVGESASSATTRPTLNQDLYPLYGGANWEVPGAESVTIGTSTYVGASVSSLVVMPTMDPGSRFTPFERYYDSKLRALGWKLDNYLAAGGHTGGQTGYRKTDGLILVRFFIDYLKVPENAPSECPCDVTLSLFSKN